MLAHYLVPVLLVGATLVSADAPRSKYLVTEIEDVDTYSLTIRLDDHRGGEMLACLGQLTGRDLSGRQDETIVAENGGVNLTYLSHRNLIVLSTLLPSPDAADRAHALGAQLKECLDLLPAPSAPTRPENH